MFTGEIKRKKEPKKEKATTATIFDIK